MNHPLWGVDLGGTQIEGVILESIDNPTPSIRTRTDTEVSQGYEYILGQIPRLVANLEAPAGLPPTHGRASGRGRGAN